MAKTLLSMPDLRRRALAEIRQQPGCHNVQDIAINCVTDQDAENNWSLCVLSPGAADANTAARAALHVQSVLRSPATLERSNLQAPVATSAQLNGSINLLAY